MDPQDLTGRINFLSVGTRILLKDTMDQYLRTLGDFKTYYAPNLTSALRTFSENPIQVVISEVDLGDASVVHLVKALGGNTGDDDLYVIVALEERSEALMALTAEIEANSVLVRPVSAADIKAQIDRYQAWRMLPKEPWQLLIREAQYAAREKKFREAETHYKDAITSAPQNPIPYYKAALYFLSKPDYGLAEGFFKKAIEMNPNYTQAISALGSLYLQKQELDKAEDWLKRAQTISPLNPDRLVEMVKLFVERSIDMCKTSLRLDSSSSIARFHLGKLLAIQKDYVGTVRELEKVLPNLGPESKNEAQTFMALARKLGSLAK